MENCTRLLDFFCEQGSRGVLQSYKLELYEACVMDETVTSVLAGKHLHITPPFYVTGVKKTHIFIPMVITKDVVELVRRNVSRGLGLG